MRLSLNLRSMVLAVLTAVPSAAAASPSACEKDVFVYVDVSTSMRTQRGGVTRLEIFTRALEELLTRTSDFLREGDRVRLVTFSGTAQAPFDEVIAGDALSRLSEELVQLRASTPDPQDDVSNATDLTLVLADLRDNLVGRRSYVIIASDLIHDPENDNAANRAARKEAFLQSLTGFLRNGSTEALPEVIILDANVAGDVDADVGNEIARALAAAPLNAERIPVTGVYAVTRALKREMGQPMIAAVVLRSDDGDVRLALEVRNPNAFPVRLLRTKMGDQEISSHEVIECGATAVIDLSAPAGTRITAEFDIGEVDPAVVPGDVLDIDATRARVLLNGPRSGTLLLHVNVRKFLKDDATVDVQVGNLTRRISIAKGVADEPVTFAIPLAANAPRLRTEDTIRAKFTVHETIDLQHGRTDGERRYREDTANTGRDWRDYILRIAYFLAILLITALLPPRGLTRRLFDAALDAELVDLLPGPSRLFGAGYAATYPFLPTYPLSGAQWTAFVNALPTALLAAIFVFYLLRFGSILVWARVIEPKGRVLPARMARLRLRWLSVTIWGCSSVTLLAVMFALGSLVPNALVAAE